MIEAPRCSDERIEGLRRGGMSHDQSLQLCWKGVQARPVLSHVAMLREARGESQEIKAEREESEWLSKMYGLVLEGLFVVESGI